MCKKKYKVKIFGVDATVSLQDEVSLGIVDDEPSLITRVQAGRHQLGCAAKICGQADDRATAAVRGGLSGTTVYGTTVRPRPQDRRSGQETAAA